MQISEVLGILAASPRLFQHTSNLEPYSLEVTITMFMSYGTIRLTIFLLHTLIPALDLNIHTSRYLNPHDY